MVVVLAAARKRPWVDRDAPSGLVSVGSRKWIEGRELVPPGADLLLLLLRLVVAVGLSTAHIGSREWNAEHVEVHDAGNGVAQVVPGSALLGEVVLRVLPRACERARGADELSVVRIGILALV